MTKPHGPSIKNGVLTFASGCDVRPVRLWTPFKRNANGDVICKRTMGFDWYVTDRDTVTGLRGFGLFHPGFCSIGLQRWSGVFWINLFGRTILQTKPINGTSR